MTTDNDHTVTDTTEPEQPAKRGRKPKEEKAVEEKPRTRWEDPGKPRDLMEDFKKAADETYAIFHVKVQFRDLVLGPAPAMLDATLARLNSAKMKKVIPPEVLESFKAEMVRRYAEAEKARADLLNREAADQDEEDAKPKPDAVAETAAKGLSVFMVDWDGIYLESRAVKSMIRDVLSIQGVFGDRGARTKTTHNLGLFVEPPRLRFVRDGAVMTAPDGVRHYPAILKDATGSHNAIVSNEYIESDKHDRASVQLEFDVLLTVGGSLTKTHLDRCLAACQLVGLGARRSQGFGQFDVVEYRYMGMAARPVSQDVLADLPDAKE